MVVTVMVRGIWRDARLGRRGGALGVAALCLMACRAPAVVEAPAPAPVVVEPAPAATEAAPLAGPARTAELVPLSFKTFVIAVDDEALYAVRGPEIVRMPLSGGELAIVARTKDPQGARQVELHGGHLYFVDLAEVWRVPKAGGSQQQVVPRQPYFVGYAVAGDTVYWLNGREPIQDTPPFRRVEGARPGVFVMSPSGDKRRVARLPELRAGSEAFAPLGPIVCREDGSLCAFVAREGVYTVDTRGTSKLLAKVLPYVLAVDGADFVAAEQGGDALWLLSTSGAPQRKLATVPGIWGVVVGPADFYVIDRVGSVLRVPRSGGAPETLVTGQNSSIVRNSTHIYALNPANERLVRIELNAGSSEALSAASAGHRDDAGASSR